MVGGEWTSSPDTNDLLSHKVGQCPFVTTLMGSVEVPCLLDTESMVTTTMGSFFNKAVWPLGKELLSLFGFMFV